LSYQQTDGFQRRLGFAGQSGDYLNNIKRLSDAEDFAKYQANAYDPNGRFNNPNRFGAGGFLEQKYGFSQLDRFGRDYDRSTASVDASGKRLSYQDFVDTSIKIEDLKKDLFKFQQIDVSGLGILGKEAIAKSIDARLPSSQELIARLNSYGQTKDDARELLQFRAQNAETFRKAEQERFQELVRQQKFAEQTRQQVQQKVDLLNKSGVAGDDKNFYAQQLLSISGELRPEEQTASLRSSRIQALNILAEAEKTKEADAKKRQENIDKSLKAIADAVTSTGVKIEDASKPLLNVEINNASSGAKATYRPDGSDVGRRNQD
jgi:hypothetical protein